MRTSSDGNRLFTYLIPSIHTLLTTMASTTTINITLLPAYILLCGRTTSGKDTCAKYLSQVWGYNVVHFADPLKEGCRHFFGFTDAQLYGEDKMKEDAFWGITPRQALQLVGTELMRQTLPTLLPGKMDDRFWLRRMERTLDENPWKSFVIADGRFPNEVEFVNEQGGKCIRIERPGVPHLDHASENQIDELQVHNTIVNDGTVVDMLRKLDAALQLDRTPKPARDAYFASLA